MPWNLRWGAVYGPDRRPCPLWPLVVFPDDVDRKIAELLAPQPRLPTPQYFAQLNFSPPHKSWIRRGGQWYPLRHQATRSSSQWLDAVNRFIFNGAMRDLAVYPSVCEFVDWDKKGSATIALDLDDSDNEADDSSEADDSDSEYTPSETSDQD